MNQANVIITQEQFGPLLAGCLKNNPKCSEHVYYLFSLKLFDKYKYTELGVTHVLYYLLDPNPISPKKLEKDYAENAKVLVPLDMVKNSIKSNLEDVLKNPNYSYQGNIIGTIGYDTIYKEHSKIIISIDEEFNIYPSFHELITRIIPYDDKDLFG
jgi:hypothetical protein